MPGFTPSSRLMSSTRLPASFSLIALIIWVSVNFDRFITPNLLLFSILELEPFQGSLHKLSIQNERNITSVFLVDQIAHMISICLSVVFYKNTSVSMLFELDTQTIILILLSIVLLTSVSSKFIKIIISQWEPFTEDNVKDSLKNAGSFIGVLERLFVFCFVISGNIEAVGFLLAAKSIFRFGDLKDAKDRKLTEYILIGTLLSFGFALIISYSYLYFRLHL